MKKLHLNPLCLLLYALVFAACQESFDERCAREAREYTAKRCPQEQGEGCVLDSTAYDISTRTYRYYYTLSGVLDDVRMRQQMVRSNGELRDELLRALRNSIALKECKEQGINFNYVYTSQSTRQRIIDVSFSKEDYGAQ